MQSIKTYQSSLVIGPGTTSGNRFTVNITGYKYYACIVQQVRDAYGMTYRVTGAGSNCTIEIKSASSNYSVIVVTVANTANTFSIVGTAYNSDSSNSAAEIRVQYIPYN